MDSNEDVAKSEVSNEIPVHVVDLATAANVSIKSVNMLEQAVVTSQAQAVEAVDEQGLVLADTNQPQVVTGSALDDSD